MYNRPGNLFVAKFLGNPPINILEGNVVNGSVVIGDFVVGKTHANNDAYTIGIRPEDFRYDPSGFEVHPEDIEHIGRDTLIKFPFGGTSVRALIDSDSVLQNGTIRLSVKAGKIHLFDKATGSVVL
jgi:multiple sugar transport system ATP-binding protein